MCFADGLANAEGTQAKPNVILKELGYYTAHFGKFHHPPRHRFPYDLVKRSEQQAADYLANFDGAKPLFLVVCTHPPHTPWLKNKDYDPAKVQLPPNFVDTPATRIDRTNYYTDVTEMDRVEAARIEHTQVGGTAVHGEPDPTSAASSESVCRSRNVTRVRP